MLTKTSEAKKISFEELFFSSWDLFLKAFKNIVFLLLVSLAFIVVLMIILALISIISNLLLANAVAENYQIILFNLISGIIMGIGFLIISSIFQILLINILIKPAIKFREQLKTIKPFLWRFIKLSLLVYLAMGVSFAPILCLGLLIYLGSANLLFYTIVLFILAIIIAAYFTVKLSLTPFILIEKNIGVIAAIKQNIRLVKDNFFKTLGFILLLWVIVGIINCLPYFAPNNQIVQIIFSIINAVIILPFSFVYLFNFYKILDKR